MPATTHNDLRSVLIGAWRLIEWYEVRPDGTVDYPLGPDAVGQLMYDPSGGMSAQLVRRGQTPFASDDWRKASADERAAAWPNYFGYFGTFRLDEDAMVVIHDIEGGWFPNLDGTEQVRHYRIEGNRLNLDADTAWGQVRIIWQKLPSA
jgi:Lipocalin-like domain